MLKNPTKILKYKSKILSVEFIGIPGSGKTYLADNLCKKKWFSKRSLSTRDFGIIRTYCRYFFILIKYSPEIIKILSQTFNANNKMTIMLLKWRLRLMFRLFIIADRRKSRVLGNNNYVTVLDQGVIQSIGSCIMSGLVIQNELMLKLIKDCAITSDNCIVIFHNADLSTAINSVYSRKEQNLPSIKMFDKHELIEYYKKMSTILENIVTLLEVEKFKVVKTFRNNNVSLSIEEITKSIY